jgi:hypothetical protein
VATLAVKDDEVVVKLTMLEKVQAVHGDLAIPRSAVTAYWAVQDGLAEVPGYKLAGASLPRAFKIGTWRDDGKSTFAVCHGAHPAIVLELSGQRYDRVIVTVDNPESALARLGVKT